MNCADRSRFPVIRGGRAPVRALAAWVLAVCIAPASAAQTEVPAEAAWPEADTVLDLLRADARAALAGKRLERAQDWLAASSVQSVSASAAPASGEGRDRIDVRAIYGVGQVLHADVSVNGALWRYRQGRRWPLGVSDPGAAPHYALASIDPPCVRLRGEGESVRTACLLVRESAHD